MQWVHCASLDGSQHTSVRIRILEFVRSSPAMSRDPVGARWVAVPAAVESTLDQLARFLAAHCAA
jgi:hypothetical protein